MPIDMVTVPVDNLEQFTFDAFSAMGMNEEEALGCTRGLIESELRCLPGQGQGVRRLPDYRQRIVDGYVNLGAEFEIVKESPALALIDAHNGLGSPAGQKAMSLAVKKAKDVGVGTVIVRNGTHYGSSGVHARLASDNDCIGVAYTNAGPEMAPGAAQPASSAPTPGPSPLPPAAPSP